MDFLLLQINDSLFPIGSYTQSFGLESYIQLGYVKNKEDALEYLKSNLNSQMLYTDLLAIKLIYNANKDLNKILKIEEYMNAATSPMELREGYIKLGSRFIKTIQSMPLESNTFFLEYIKSTLYPFHATAYGSFCVSYDMDMEVAIKHYLYAQTSGIVTNCVKTIPLSQNDGQAILTLMHQEFNKVYEKLKTLDHNLFCNASIHNDIKAMQHERLYSRLYMS
ncbi:MULTISPECIES: urease accessory protein UreF [unclassified Helicobacter]|uniref:urease accessory protein UreF n=1 Tax=unclassified Helicobacter TaxID=2593540 RepID=UPI000CF0717C|nr:MULTISPECIES: urease accessory protein UreF [unclassified Helicobacter]